MHIKSLHCHGGSTQRRVSNGKHITFLGKVDLLPIVAVETKQLVMYTYKTK